MCVWERWSETKESANLLIFVVWFKKQKIDKWGFYSTILRLVDWYTPWQPAFSLVLSLWDLERWAHLAENHFLGMLFACTLCGLCRCCALGTQVNSWKWNGKPPPQASLHNQGYEATFRMTGIHEWTERRVRCEQGRILGELDEFRHPFGADYVQVE